MVSRETYYDTDPGSDRLYAEIADRMRQSLDIKETLQTTVEEVRSLLKADRVFVIWIRSDGSGEICAESVDPSQTSALGMVFDPTATEKSRRDFVNQPLRVEEDVTRMPNRHPELIAFHNYLNVKATLAMILGRPSQPYALLVAHQCQTPRPWLAEEVALVERLAPQMDSAIQQAEMYQRLEDTIQSRTAELSRSMEQLIEINQLKDHMLHALTHDLQTPLLGSIMFLRPLLKTEAESITLPRPIVARLLESQERSLSLLQSLLQIETPTNPPTRLQPIYCKRLVEITLESIKLAINEAQAQVQLSVGDRLPKVQGDLAQLQKVLEALLLNVLTHNEPGRQIIIDAELTSETHPQLRLSVRDNGQGLQPEQIHQLFDRPYLRSKHEVRRTGMGMGLYLSAQIIKAHGGQMGVESQPGLGSTFWFTLPLSPSD
ncbi:MAG: GAF domain-containing sensor histidine kinase [Alkalinema sp. RU_4_3]|nr:GAF domain-containing sensor histidine kinase [Alkalinema sp. RU_4_3]